MQEYRDNIALLGTSVVNDEDYYRSVRRYDVHKRSVRSGDASSSRKAGGSEIYLSVARTYSSESNQIYGESPFLNDENGKRYSGYSSAYRRKMISDRWTFFFTIPIENLFSAISGGLMWILVVLFLFFFLVCGFWTAVLSIPDVSEQLSDRSLSPSLAALGFIVAIVTSDQISRRERMIITPLRRYFRMTQAIRRLQNNVFTVYRAKLLSLERIIFRKGRSLLNSPDVVNDLNRWLQLADMTLSTTATHMQLLALWSLRIFLEYDPMNDYSQFGITQREIAYSRNLPIEEYGYVNSTPMTIVRSLIQHQKQQIQATTEKVSDNAPVVEEHQANLLVGSVESLENIADEVELASNVFQPQIFATSKNFVLAVFLLVVIPIDIFASVDVLTLIVGPVVLFLYSMLLVILWYLGSPFQRYPRWEGPRFYEWRRDIYRSVQHNERTFTKWVDRAQELLDTLRTGELPSNVEIVKMVDLRLIAEDSDLEDDEDSWRNK